MMADKTRSDRKKGKRDPDLVSAEIAIKRAAETARKRADQAGIGVVVMRDGKIVEEKICSTVDL